MRRTPSSPPDLPGYRYLSLLGSGGFSDVFLYDQDLPRRQVAVKVLLTEELTDASRARFVAEANVMAQLSAHPYIVTIFHADVASDDRPYLVMEYCSGPSLATQYKQRPFRVDDALRTGIRLSSAIATAHGAGILHRDIKPGNVLTNAFGWPALTDFGIASALEELPVHTTSRPRASLGETGTGSGSGDEIGMSVPWSPPEMFEDDPRPDVRSDVFSLAATIHTLLAGRTPFEVPGRSNGTLDLIGRIERGAITPIGRPDLPRTLTAVLGKGMAARREDRYASAVEFGRALQRIELELGYAPTAIEVPNLFVSPDDADGDGDGDDATRVRDIAVINAQLPDTRPAHGEADAGVAVGGDTRAAVRPAPAPGRAEGTGAAGDADDAAESTMLRAPAAPHGRAAERGATAASASRGTDAGAGEQRGDEPDSPTGLSRRGRIALAVASSAAVVLIAAGIIAALSIPRAATTPVQTAPPGQSGVTVSTIPVPKLVSVTRTDDGHSVHVVWRNPKPAHGDAYLWARAETPEKVTHVTKPEATVTGVSADQKVCISIWTLRDGRTSAQALDACTS